MGEIMAVLISTEDPFSFSVSAEAVFSFHCFHEVLILSVFVRRPDCLSVCPFRILFCPHALHVLVITMAWCQVVPHHPQVAAYLTAILAAQLPVPCSSYTSSLDTAETGCRSGSLPAEFCRAALRREFEIEKSISFA